MFRTAVGLHACRAVQRASKRDKRHSVVSISTEQVTYLDKRLRALQVQQAILLLHTTKLLRPPVGHEGNDFTFQKLVLTVLTNALRGRETALSPKLQEGSKSDPPAVRHAAAQRHLCEYLHGLTGIEARIAPHGDGYAVYLD